MSDVGGADAPPQHRTNGDRSPGAAPPRRFARVLIDPRFQLKYTGLLVAVVLLLLVVLGVVIGRTATVALDYADLATAEAERALHESRQSSKITVMNAMAEFGGDPELVETVEAATREADQEALGRLEEVKLRRAEMADKRQQLMLMLVAAGLILLVSLVFLGIYITQKIVRPVAKLKRLLRQVGTSQIVTRERLRRGDELEDLFDTFLQMTYSLRALQAGRLATLDAALRRAELAGASSEVVSTLRALRAQLALGLDRVEVPDRPRATGSQPARAS